MEELVDQIHQLLVEKGQLPYDIDAIAKLHSERFGRQPRACEIHEALRLLRVRRKLRCEIRDGKPYLTLNDPQTTDDSGEQP